jgi:flagellar hook capping protein FlgD
MAHGARPCDLLGAGAAALVALAALAVPVAAQRIPARAVHAPPVPLSSDGERLFRDLLHQGKLTSHPLAPGVLRREALEENEAIPWEPGRPPEAPLRSITPGAFGLAADVQVSDRTGDVTCAGGCASRPLSQAETAIAAWAPYVLVGWNDTKGFCDGGAVQGYGYSSDDGLTFVDAGAVPPPGTGGRYRGDPVHAVNRKTGRFYVLGIYENAGFAGLVALTGHFSGGSFVIDVNRQVAFAASGDFFDKPWMSVDSLSGNVYVTWTNFTAAGGSNIELQRLDPLLNALGAVQVLTAHPEFTAGVQSSQSAIGPDGELYVAWWESHLVLPSFQRIVRSNDFGASFGAEQTVASFIENPFSMPPGSRRTFGLHNPSLAVDATHGPRAGRVYVAWDEPLDWRNASFSSASAKSEVENNGFFKNATPFTVGQVVRGSMGSSSDNDLWKFSGLHQQTLVMSGDTTETTGFSVRIICPADTSSFASYRHLANTDGTSGGLVFTLPYDGDYYLQFLGSGATVGPYKFLTTFMTPSLSDRGRDTRDQFVAHSDDGATWSAPVKVNDSDPWHDGCYPQLAVDDLGRVHCFWHDWRADPVCGALSYEYTASSGDGGVTWGANRQLSDVATFWSLFVCGSANQGDYQFMTAQGARVYAAFADPRNGDPDVFVDATTHLAIAECHPLAIVPAGRNEPLDFSLVNDGSIATPLSWQIDDTAGWLTGASPGFSGTQTVAADGGALAITATVHAPSPCPGDSDVVRFIVGDPFIPGRADTCKTVVRCSGTTGVPEATAGLGFWPPAPTPSRGPVRLRFTLGSQGPARLSIYTASGTNVATVVSGPRPAGPGEVVWDGRDARGRLVPAGLYFAQLEAEGRSLRRTVLLLR